MPRLRSLIRRSPPEPHYDGAQRAKIPDSLSSQITPYLPAAYPAQNFYGDVKVSVKWPDPQIPPCTAYLTAAVVTPPPPLNFYPDAVLKVHWNIPESYGSTVYIPPFVPPAAPVPAGRHHKRYAVKLSGRTVYFATRAEAEAARITHKQGRILEGKAAGLPLKIVRRTAAASVGPVRVVKTLAPPQPPTPVALVSNEAIKAAAIEGQDRELEEIALALLMAYGPPSVPKMSDEDIAMALLLGL